MARQQYQPRKFLRDAPNALLKRYFQERGLLLDVDFDALKDETDIEAIYEAWQALPREPLDQTEADFRAVDEMAEAEAIGIVITEGCWHGEELGPVLEQLEGMCHKMLWMFIEKPRVFEVAYKFCQADNLPLRYWRKRKRKDMPAKAPAPPAPIPPAPKPTEAPAPEEAPPAPAPPEARDRESQLAQMEADAKAQVQELKGRQPLTQAIEDEPDILVSTALYGAVQIARGMTDKSWDAAMLGAFGEGIRNWLDELRTPAQNLHNMVLAPLMEEEGLSEPRPAEADWTD